MTIKRKITRYQRIKAELQQLEREIKAEASAHFKKQGLLVNPRFERVIEQFGG